MLYPAHALQLRYVENLVYKALRNPDGACTIDTTLQCPTMREWKFVHALNSGLDLQACQRRLVHFGFIEPSLVAGGGAETDSGTLSAPERSLSVGLQNILPHLRQFLGQSMFDAWKLCVVRVSHCS